MADINFEKKYYSSILGSINRNDSHNFYNEMLNAIKGGNMEVFLTRSRQQLSFDSTWIHQISDYLRYVENIVRNPRIYMLAVEEVTPIQRAKKINARSIQHLSSHVQNVQELRKDGTIVPSKVLSTTFEDTFAIYENRFVMTLINKLAAFVEVRYDSILESIKSYQMDKIVAKSSFVWRNYSIDAKIELNVKEEILDEVSKKNKELLDDIIVIRNYVRGFMTSSFYQTMKERTRPVTPPILRTNIITKSVDYNSCLKLWLFLDSYRQLGVDLEVMDKELPFDDKFVDEVSDMLFMNYSLFVSNQEDRKENYELLPFKKRKEKKPKVNKLLVAHDEEEGLKDDNINEPTISEYFYQRVKKNYKTEFTEQINSGISYNKAFLSVYKKMLKIENGIQDEIVESMQKRLPVTNSIREKRRAKHKQYKKMKGMYENLIAAKELDLEKARQKLEKLNETLEKYAKEEKEYQLELRRQKRKQQKEELELQNKNDEEKKKEEKIKKKKESIKKIPLPVSDKPLEIELPKKEDAPVVAEPNDEEIKPSVGINSRTARLLEYLQKARQASRSKEVKVESRNIDHNEEK